MRNSRRLLSAFFAGQTVQTVITAVILLLKLSKPVLWISVIGGMFTTAILVGMAVLLQEVNELEHAPAHHSDEG